MPANTAEVTFAPESPHLARWERDLLELLRVLRKSEKPLMIVVRWDGLTWAFQECKPPVRVPEK